MESSHEVRFRQIEERKDATARFRVRWVVAGRRFGRSFITRGLADSFQAQIIAAARNGQSFDLETGLPQSLLRINRDVTCCEHAREYLASAWAGAAAKAGSR
jgi:hypothetical protein